MYYDIDDLIAGGQVSIAGWQPSGPSGLVTAGGALAQLQGQNQLANLLGASAGAYDELSMEDMGFSGAQANQAIQAAVARRMVNTGLVVTPERPTKAREFPLGFESPAAVPAGGAATITSRPQIPFRGERLIVPSDIAGSFSILDLRVGKNSQFTSSGAVPARTFQENAVGIRLMLDTAQISQDVTLQVLNIGGAPQIFRAAIIGSAVE